MNKNDEYISIFDMADALLSKVRLIIVAAVSCALLGWAASTFTSASIRYDVYFVSEVPSISAWEIISNDVVNSVSFQNMRNKSLTGRGPSSKITWDGQSISFTMRNSYSNSDLQLIVKKLEEILAEALLRRQYTSSIKLEQIEKLLDRQYRSEIYQDILETRQLEWSLSSAKQLAKIELLDPVIIKRPAVHVVIASGVLGLILAVLGVLTQFGYTFYKRERASSLAE